MVDNLSEDRLPGMGDSNFDYCTCGVGWPMGNHHAWPCPAHCICGMIDRRTHEKTTCGYHAGTSRIPIGPSVMTERWDLTHGI